MDWLFHGPGIQSSEISMLAGLASFWSLAQFGGGHCCYTLVFLGGMVDESLSLFLVYIQLCSIPPIRTPAIGFSVCLNPF